MPNNTYLYIAYEIYLNHMNVSSGRIAQSVTCLTADTCLTANPGVASTIPARSHTFTEIDHEIISTDSRMVVVSHKRKYVHKVLVKRFVNLAQEKSVVRLTDCPDMTIAVDWDVKNQTKQTNMNV